MRVKPQIAVLNRGDPIVKGLVFDLPFTERSGLNVRETTGLIQKDLIYHMFTNDDWVTTPYGAAMDFGSGDGAGRRLWFNPTQLENNRLNALNGLTIEGIWRFTNSNQFGFLTSYYDGLLGWRKYSVTRNNSILENTIRLSNDTNLNLNHSGMVTNAWMHTFMVYDLKYGRTYLNGKLMTEVASTVTIKSSTHEQFNVGSDRNDWTGGDLYGEMALCRIWDRGLNKQEVSKLTADPWRIYFTRKQARGLTSTTKIYSRGNYGTLPTDDTDLETAFGSGEYPTVAADDGSRIDQAAGEQNKIFLFKQKAAASDKSIPVEWNGQSDIAPSLKEVFLQIYNRNSAAWETLASNNVAAADIDFTIEGLQSTDLSYYYDASFWVACRVYQPG